MPTPHLLKDSKEYWASREGILVCITNPSGTSGEFMQVTLQNSDQDVTDMRNFMHLSQNCHLVPTIACSGAAALKEKLGGLVVQLSTILPVMKEKNRVIILYITGHLLRSDTLQDRGELGFPDMSVAYLQDWLLPFCSLSPTFAR